MKREKSLRMAQEWKRRDCTKHIVVWFEVSACFYLGSFLLCMIIFMIIRKQGLQSETVNWGWVEWLFFVYQPRWPYVILVSIDLIHLGLTIWGTIEFFTDLIGLIECYLELPILSNFMFIVWNQNIEVYKKELQIFSQVRLRTEGNVSYIHLFRLFEISQEFIVVQLGPKWLEFVLEQK
eukprot:403369950